MSFTIGREMVSAPLNIFIALRLFVDHSKMTPSREPDAKKLPTCMDGYLFGVWVCCVCTLFIKRIYPSEIWECKHQSKVCTKFRKCIANSSLFTTVKALFTTHRHTY